MRRPPPSLPPSPCFPLPRMPGLPSARHGHAISGMDTANPEIWGTWASPPCSLREPDYTSTRRDGVSMTARENETETVRGCLGLTRDSGDQYQAQRYEEHRGPSDQLGANRGHAGTCPGLEAGRNWCSPCFRNSGGWFTDWNPVGTVEHRVRPLDGGVAVKARPLCAAGTAVHTPSRSAC